jgi:hypothetical protein
MSSALRRRKDQMHGFSAGETESEAEESDGDDDDEEGSDEGSEEIEEELEEEEEEFEEEQARIEEERKKKTTFSSPQAGSKRRALSQLKQPHNQHTPTKVPKRRKSARNRSRIPLKTCSECNLRMS